MMRSALAVAVLIAAFGVKGAQAADDCGRAALNYYCTGVTLALSQATETSDLAAALKTMAGSYGKKAKRLSYKNLQAKYQSAGVEDASKSTDPDVMQRLLAICVKADETAVGQFMRTTGVDCLAKTGSSGAETTVEIRR
jgi:hypothetical protein